MKEIKLNDTLLRKAVLVINSSSLYLNGSIAIKDKYIFDTFYQSKIHQSVKSFSNYDLKNNIIMPAFIAFLRNPFALNDLKSFEYSLFQKGIGSFFIDLLNIEEYAFLSYNIPLAGFLGYRCYIDNADDLGYITDLNYLKAIIIDENINQDLLKRFVDNNIKIIKRDCFVNKDDYFKLDGCGKLNNLFKNKKHYEIVGDLKAAELNILLNLLPRSLATIAPVLNINNNSIEGDLIYFLKEAIKTGRSYNEISPLLNQNILSFYQMEEKRGVLKKGYYADLLLIDSAGDLLLNIREGRVLL